MRSDINRFEVLDAVEHSCPVNDVMCGCSWRQRVEDHTDVMFKCLRRSDAYRGTDKVKHVLAHATPCSAGKLFEFTPRSA